MTVEYTDDMLTQADIARILSRAEMLQRVFLDLDFHDDHGPPGKGHWEPTIMRFDPIHEARGFELVTIMERCPHLQYVALLRHFELASQWVEYHPSRCANSRFVYGKKYVAVLHSSLCQITDSLAGTLSIPTSNSENQTSLFTKL